MQRHVYVKLGGALLTDKDGHESLRPDVLAAMAAEIADFVDASSSPLIVGHGSGSFAHVAARASGFVDRPTPLATAHVGAAARRLNSHVVDALLEVGLPAMPLPAAAWVVCDDGTIAHANTDCVSDLLQAGLLPVVYGDTAPDRTRGGAIASTEPLLVALANRLPAERIVLATDVDGVYPVDPHVDTSAAPLAEITTRSAGDAWAQLGTRADADDVTGGMATKVAYMLSFVQAHPSVEVRIVSGLRPGAVRAALAGESDAGGTVVRAG